MAKVKETTRKRQVDLPNGGRGRKRIPGKTRLSAKNQITIPVSVVRKAGLKTGEALVVEVDDAGRILVTPDNEVNSILEFAGCLTGVYPPNYLEDLRAGDRERERRLGFPMGDEDEQAPHAS